jgi:Ran-binding protein 1
MSDHAETKQDPTPVSDPDTIAKEDTATDAPSTADSTKVEGDQGSVTGAESSGVGSGLTAATTDNVFSMFGGGPKKEKREEPEGEEDEPSGSSKAKKDADDAEVGVRLYFFCPWFLCLISGSSCLPIYVDCILPSYICYVTFVGVYISF